MSRRIRIETVVDVSPEDIVDGSFTKDKATPKQLVAFITKIDDYACNWAVSKLAWEYFERQRRRQLRQDGIDWLPPRDRRKTESLRETNRRLLGELDLAHDMLKEGRKAAGEKFRALQEQARQADQERRTAVERYEALSRSGSDHMRRMRTAIAALEDLKDNPRAAKALEDIGLTTVRAEPETSEITDA